MGKKGDGVRKTTKERLNILRGGLNEKTVFVVGDMIKDSSVDPHVIVYHDKNSPVTEQYRVLRTNIQSINSANPPKMIVVTSSIHNEGKSVTALNLAMALAVDPNNRNVLLIDADIRKGRIEKLLGINSTKGLSEVLCENVPIEEALVKTAFTSLKILTKGIPPYNPAELLSSAKMKKLLTEIRTKFDYVIIDTPPIIPLTDPGIIGQLADGAILVVQLHRTQRGMVKQARSLLEQAKVKVLGFILTQVEHPVPDYIYRYL
ncbi:MAG: CpsD/CapB family tyrosine-protein kinase [Candidatus Omnitrophota bacterium]